MRIYLFCGPLRSHDILLPSGEFIGRMHDLLRKFCEVNTKNAPRRMSRLGTFVVLILVASRQDLRSLAAVIRSVEIKRQGRFLGA